MKQTQAKIYQAQAFGSSMLLGEHAVMYGYPAIICAINKRVLITCKKRNDKKISIHSNYFGNLIYDIQSQSSQNNNAFKYVLAVLQYYQTYYQQYKQTGYDISITGNCLPSIGFGSSTAVTVALVDVLAQTLKLNFSKQMIFSTTLFIIRKIQYKASGADIAASIYGKIIYFMQEKINILESCNLCDIILIYCGYKTETQKVTSILAKNMHCNPKKYDQLYKKISNLVVQAKKCLLENDFCSLGLILNDQQILLQQIKVSDPHLDFIIKKLQNCDNILGAKISGSGLGDCILTLGNLTEEYFQNNIIDKINNKQLAQKVKKFHLNIAK